MIAGLGAALCFTPLTWPSQRQTILLGDQAEADASPLVHDLCSMYMKAGLPVVFVSFKQPYECLVAMYRRLGHDLNMLEAQRLYKYIDGSKYLLGNEDLEYIIRELDVCVEGQQRGLIVLEEVSLFESIKPDISSLVALIDLVNMHDTFDRIFRCTSNDQTKLYRWLVHRSSFVLESRSLSSGLSREFHSELSCKHGGKSYLFPRIPSAPFLVRYTESSVFLGLKGSQLA